MLHLGRLAQEVSMRDLTQKQEDILNFILDSIAHRGRFPSFREIGRAFRLSSVATVAQHLQALVEKGFLIKEGRKLLPAPGVRHDQGVPIVGRVAAGRPISAIENHEGQLAWDSLGGGGAFAVRVVGDSMIEEGILEGDFAIVQPAETAQNGDLVVAYLGEEQEVTVKRYYRRAGQVELRPANSEYRPIKVKPRDPNFRLAGRVVGIVRRV
jgi:repressor LexA